MVNFVYNEVCENFFLLVSVTLRGEERDGRERNY